MSLRGLNSRAIVAYQKRFVFESLTYKGALTSSDFCWQFWLADVLRATAICAIFAQPAAPTALPSLAFDHSGAQNYGKKHTISSHCCLSGTCMFLLTSLSSQHFCFWDYLLQFFLRQNWLTIPNHHEPIVKTNYAVYNSAASTIINHHWQWIDHQLSINTPSPYINHPWTRS